jgi:MFS family permease
MIVARIVSGIGMGFINSTCPVLQAEFSPKAARGRFVCAQLSTLNFGIMMVYWIDYGFQRGAGGAALSYVWRVPTILQCFFLIPMLFICFIIPETPRWLAAHDRNEECLTVLRRMHAGKLPEEEIKAQHNLIVRTVALETQAGAGSWMDLFRSDVVHTRRRFFIACAIQIFQQLGGINALIYYANTLFMNSLGFSAELSGLMAGFLNTWFFLASFIPWFLIDRIGRRPLVSILKIILSIDPC